MKRKIISNKIKNEEPSDQVYYLDSYFHPQQEKKRMLGANIFLQRFFTFFLKSQTKFTTLIKKKRKEQLTLMFIPHNENRIKNYNISNLSLTILAGTVIIFFLLGSILIINHTSTVQEVGKLKRSQQDSRIQFVKIREEVKGVSLAYEKIKAILSDIVELTGGKESLKGIYQGLGGAAIPIANLKDNAKQAPINRLKLEKTVAEEHALDQKESIPMEIFILDRMIDDMSMISRELDYLDDHTKRNLKSIRNSPTLWPVNGYIANPFGFIRKASNLKASFNSGFDITVPPGTKVLVTAPGSIDEITREKNSLLTVSIKHHYGYKTIYHGLSSLTSELNTPLAKGDTIGYMGMVSGPTRNTLHYEIYIGTEAQDPAIYLYPSKE